MRTSENRIHNSSSTRAVDGRTCKAIRACRRCRRRHVRCHMPTSQQSCDACRDAKEPCIGRTDYTFKLSGYVSRRTTSPTSLSGSVSPVVDQLSRPASAPVLADVDSNQPIMDKTSEVISERSGDAHVPDTESLSSSPSDPDRGMFLLTQGDAPCDVEVVRESLPPQASIAPDYSSTSPNFCSDVVVTPEQHINVTHGLDAEATVPSFDIQNPLSQRPILFPSVSEHGISYSTEKQQGGLWPLENVSEAALLSHFCTHLAIWFDYCDPHKHFASQIIALAAEDQTLLYALLAVAAKHRARLTGLDDGSGDYYQHRCLDILIPALGQMTDDLTDNLLATALVLRLFEEMTEPSQCDSVTSHTLNARLLFKMKHGTRQSSFSHAAVFVVLRQEIFIANLTRRPFELVQESCNIDASLEPTDEAMWAYRIISRTADITNFVHDHSINQTLTVWKQHWHYIEEWDLRKPVSFQALFWEMQPGDTLPQIWFINDLQLAAFQHYKLCQLLLIAVDPEMPIIGLNRAQNRNSQLRKIVREICGAALSNRKWHPAKVTAGLSIAMFGDLFHDTTDRSMLMEILRDSEQHLGWPCLRVGDRLQAIWCL